MYYFFVIESQVYQKDFYILTMIFFLEHQYIWLIFIHPLMATKSTRRGVSPIALKGVRGHS